MEKRSIEDPDVNVLDRTSTWMDGIFAYLTDGTLPDDPAERRILKRRATGFAIIQGCLFKKSFNQPYVKCVTPEAGRDVLDDIHQGHCGSHIGGRALAEKVVR